MTRTSARALLAAVAAATLAAVAAVAFIATAPAYAATWHHVTGFGSNPGNLDMYHYRPAGLGDDAPVVVALHGCTQDAAAFHAHSGWREAADTWGFALVYPQQRTANHMMRCFHWFEAAHTTRDRGEAHSIAQMVDHVVADGADPDRVFVTGLSAGGAMAAAMLATYPDRFAGGSVVAGLPYRCAPPHSYTICQLMGVSSTPQQWGELVRAAYPEYAGPAPRVAVWHGTADYTVTPANATELVKQWTNVAGVPDQPTQTETLPGGTTLERYGDDVVRRYLITGLGHGQPVAPGHGCGTAGAYFLDAICAAEHDAVWWGLADGATPGPTPPATPSAPPTGSPSPTGSPTATGSPSPTGSPTATGSPTSTSGPTPTAAPVCVSASNYAHTQAGRAYHRGGYAYAAGSDDNLGLWNVFTTTRLQQVAPGHWVRGC